MSRDYKAYLKDILNCINKIQSFSQGYDYPSFIKDEKTVDAIIRNIEIIGEAVKHLPEDIKVLEPLIPWNVISGMRDKLIHDYFGIDTNFVWSTVVEDIPFLKEKLTSLLNSLSK